MKTSMTVRVRQPEPIQHTQPFADFMLGEFVMVDVAGNEAVGVKISENTIAWVKMHSSVSVPPPCEHILDESRHYRVPTNVDIAVVR